MLDRCSNNVERPSVSAASSSIAENSGESRARSMSGSGVSAREVIVAVDGSQTGESLSDSGGSEFSLPWGRSRDHQDSNHGITMLAGEYVLHSIFVDFTQKVDKKIDGVLAEPLARPLSKSFQRGEDPQFDQLISCFYSVAEYCLPSLLRTLLAWYEYQNVDYSHLSVPESGKQKSDSSKSASGSTKSALELSEKEHVADKRNLAVDYLFALVLIEILKQLPFHPGHDELIAQVESLSFKHFKYRDPIVVGPNNINFHIVSDLYAEVIGVLAQSRFQSVRRKFMAELKELRFKEISPPTVNNIIALLMGMKFFRVKMVPIEDFEACFQFMQECGTYFLEVKEKDIKHAMAGLLVEILMPVAACVKNEVNVPVVKNFVEMLYPTTLDMCSKKKHSLALFPLVTCLLCVSHKHFFLHNWHHFLTLCLSNLKNRDIKMSRVALESLYRLLWVYMIRIKCESNSVTASRLQSIVNSLFPKGSKVVVPRDTPLNIFVKIIQFIAQERMDFAMKEIVFDLLSVGRPIRVLMPERMSIGLRAFLVIADNLQQKEGEPPMPRSLGILPSGNTIRVKKIYVSKVLTDEEAKAIGMASYYPLIRKTFEEMIRLLDAQVGRTMMVTSNLNQNSKETDEQLTGERKPKIDLLKTCVAAIPRLLPDAMSISDLMAFLSRLTVHIDEDLRGLAYQAMQSILVDFCEHREVVMHVLIQFIVTDITDAYPGLFDTSLRMVIQFIIAWRNALSIRAPRPKNHGFRNSGDGSLAVMSLPMVLYEIESLALLLLCQSRHTPRRLAVVVLKETNALRQCLGVGNYIPSAGKGMGDSRSLLDVIDSFCKVVVEQECLAQLPSSEKVLFSPALKIDLQWVVDRAVNVWNAGFADSNVPLMQILDSAASVRSSLTPPNNSDVWTSFISGLMNKKGFLGSCPPAILAHIWPMVYSRLQAVLALIDLGPANENRASLVSLKTVRKVLTERDLYFSLWKNYLIVACSVLPPHTVFSGSFRCISPDIALSTSSSESNCSEKTEVRFPAIQIPAVTAHGFYKMAVRLLRSEAIDLPESVVLGLGKTNPEALRDLLEELVPLIKEAIDRKQENVRRKKRKDALRLQLIKMFYVLAKEDSIVSGPLYTSENSKQSFLPAFAEYVDGTRLYLETETDKENLIVLASIQLHFCKFIHSLIQSFFIELREHLFIPTQRQLLFNLFSGWTGRFACFPKDSGKPAIPSAELEFCALQAMSSVLCCGKVFDRNLLSEDSALFRWLDMLLASSSDTVRNLSQETVTLLLCMNPDTPFLLDWVVDRCYTGSEDVADSCFQALASVFCSRDYPCDQFSSIINLALMNTGCPRVTIQELALELLQILDKRFFGQMPVYGSPERINTTTDSTDSIKSNANRSTLNDVLLSGGNYTRNQVFLSEQLAKLHPDLTMSIFSEITYRFQTARPSVRYNLLTYIVPWMYNLELVDFSFHGTSDDVPVSDVPVSMRGQGWGSPEATEMVLNNMMYISTKFGDELPKEIECMWSSICCAWPNNLNIVLKYLVIVSSLSPWTVLPIAKRVVRYMARARPERLIDHLIDDLQSIENVCVTVEKILTPPFFRVTGVRKLPVSGIVSDKRMLTDEFTSGTIHTKRHVNEDSLLTNAPDDMSKKNSLNSPTTSTPLEMSSKTGEYPEDASNFVPLLPHPLPMPEYGGYFAPMGDLLNEPGANITTMHRCSFAISFLGDLLLDGLNVAWIVHLPIMLHIAVLGLDSQRSSVYQHCRKLLENLLVVFACHNDHCSVAQLLLGKKSVLPPSRYYTDRTSRRSLESLCYLGYVAESVESLDSSMTLVENETESKTDDSVTNNIEYVVMELIDLLASNTTAALWAFEDITAKMWTCKSVVQLSRFVRCINRAFTASLPLSRITQRWAEIAFQYGLNSSSRHYAGRSLQIYRALDVPFTFQALSDILSRLVETVTEPGDDMQGYVTELMLTLEASTESLSVEEVAISSTEEVAVKMEKTPMKQEKHGHNRTISFHLPKGGQDADYRQRSVSDSGSNIHRSYSTQTLTNFPPVTTDGTLSLDDKLSLLSLLFWISMSALESDYEHEFLLGLRLMEKVLGKLCLSKPDCQERVEKVRVLAKWTTFPGIQSLVLKGCTSASTYEPTLRVLTKFSRSLDNPIVDPHRMVGFPLNVLAFLPYQMLHFDDPNALCLESAKDFAEVSKSSDRLENFSAVMLLYHKRTFNKDAKQWGKCVVKYLFDAFHEHINSLITFLIEMMEKGPATIQHHTLNIVYYFLHYVDIGVMSNSVTAELLRVVTRLVDGPNWRECQNLIKLAVIRSSTLMPPGSNINAQSSSISFETAGLMSPTHFAEAEIVVKKQLPGRTLDFAFDVSVTPIVGRKHGTSHRAGENDINIIEMFGELNRKQKDVEASQSDWRRSALSQSRTRERLVGLLAVCGQRVGMPKSPSIVFNQFGDTGEMSVCSSSDDATSTIVGGDAQHRSSIAGENSLRDDRSTSENTFTVFKDFDFLEYELDSGENESIDNFNWGVRRSLSNVRDVHVTDGFARVRPRSATGELLSPRKEPESSDDEVGSVEIVEMLHDESSVDPVDGELAEEAVEQSTSISDLTLPRPMEAAEHPEQENPQDSPDIQTAIL
ncbi:protein furry homolog-like isoform X2 [Paramacrobiotus metropolitanus]|nr:protein furry homolog-like isoform X2 [Paramacrobiotus metropolitanus]XP_055333457.1 protein furry homolog-like isoform X2 [Paramacrobiotus metropolitanus]XP_055333458.1 protein furry homolog-like isoform X2 [Paramacrobiotus metropolitanus]